MQVPPRSFSNAFGQENHMIMDISNQFLHLRTLSQCFRQPVRKICEHFSAAVGCVVILGWVHLLLQHHPYIGIEGKYDGGI